MLINNIIFCDNTQQAPSPDTQQDVTILINPMPELVPPFFPGLLSFSVSFGFDDVQTGKTYQCDLVFCDPSENVLAHVHFPLSLQNEATSVTCCADLRNVRLESEGLHTVKITVDQLSASAQIMVRKKG